MPALCVVADLWRRRRLSNGRVRRTCLRSSAERGPDASAHARANHYAADFAPDGFAIATSHLLAHEHTYLVTNICIVFISHRIL